MQFHDYHLSFGTASLVVRSYIIKSESTGATHKKIKWSKILLVRTSYDARERQNPYFSKANILNVFGSTKSEVFCFHFQIIKMDKV